MKHLIADKLNFLMKTTATRNNMLSRALAFDPSHISRIRNGERGLPSHREFIVPAASYFARAVHTDSQKRILAGRICPGKPWPQTLEDATLLIARWLGEGQKINFEELNRYLEQTDPNSNPDNEKEDSGKTYTTKYYPGNEGKRQCVIRFLVDVAAAEEPLTLLLHSEENMEWLYENPEFAKQWGELLVTILKKGCKIVIVHTINRSFEEMMEAVAKWAPLYAVGNIEPYYTARLRDNVFQRTLFIARGRSAILAHSTGNPSVNRLNILVTEPLAVEALEQEFYDFLSMCRPLMQIFTPANFLQIVPVLSIFRKSKSGLMQFHITPSLVTLPDKVAENLSRRPGCKELSTFLDNHKKWLFMSGNYPVNITDIICLPEISAVTDGLVPVSMSVMFGFPPLFYTAEEYLQHLTSTLQWIKTSKSYQAVVLPPDTIDPVSGRAVSPTFSIVSSQQAGVLLFSTRLPSALFYTREQFMTSSFWEYLNRFVKNAASREESAERLQQYIDKLKRAIE